MSTPDHSIDGRILDSAKTEFLDKGFAEASMRDICKKAGVSTGAFYKRYDSKDELFYAVVQQTIDDLDEIVKRQASFNTESIPDKQLCDMCDLAKQEDETLQWLKFLYDRRDDMFLLLARAENSRYSNFQHDWVEQVMEANYRFFEEIERRGLTEFHTSKQELHILQSAYWQALYEPFIHRATWEEIEIHCRYISCFFNWPDALGFRER
jgi:AcrR family transcriptional regulator